MIKNVQENGLFHKKKTPNALKKYNEHLVQLHFSF